MSQIQKIQFNTIPEQIKAKDQWLLENKDSVEIVGEIRSPYRMKTKRGYPRKTDLETITIYYKEK